jgi:hypothetical protein
MRYLVKKIFRIIIVNRWYTVLSIIYSLVIKELTPEGKIKHPYKQAKNNKLTILVLSVNGFRSDIDCITKTNEIRVLLIPEHWQTRLVYQFYPVELQKYCFQNNPDHLDYKYRKEQKEIREFLYGFLETLYKRVVIDCVISPHPRYMADMDWGAVSTKLGVPHILLARDSQFASSSFLLKMHKHIFSNDFPKFEGKHIIIQSELDREVYVDSGYAKSEMISSLGRPRMDKFIKNVNKKGFIVKKRRKKVVLLPFFCREYGIFEKSDLSSYVREVNLFFVHLSIRYPEIDVVIKTKPKGIKEMQESLSSAALKELNVELNTIPNLIIRGDIDLHSLFIESDVVCGLHTSALLEAAVIGLPIIIPYFNDLQNPKYDERLYYREAYDLFDIAEDTDEFESLILKRLDNPSIDDTIIKKRYCLFEKFISNLEGKATEQYVACIKEVITREDNKKNNRQNSCCN